MDPLPTATAPALTRTRFAWPSQVTRLFLLVYLPALLGLVMCLPSVALAAEGEAFPGPTWAWIGAMLLQALVTVVGGVAVVLVREALRNQRDSMDRLVSQLEDTRLHYVSHKQLNQRLEDVLTPVRKDLEDLEDQVRSLNTTIGQVAKQNGQILALLDPRGMR